MWKTTDRYVQQKRVKAVEAELKLKQVYVPQYNATTKGGAKASSLYNGTQPNGADVNNMTRPCESCSILKSSQVGQTTAIYNFPFFT